MKFYTAVYTNDNIGVIYWFGQGDDIIGVKIGGTLLDIIGAKYVSDFVNCGLTCQPGVKWSFPPGLICLDLNLY